MKLTTQLVKCASMVVAALATALLLHGRPAAFAQPNPEAPNRPQPPAGVGRRSDRPKPEFQPGRALPMLERALTEEQRESLHSAIKSQHDSMRNLEGKIRAARQALMKASLAAKFDEETVRVKALAVGKLETELAVLRAKAMSKVQPPLSQEQIERISNPPPPREIDGPPDGPHPGPRQDQRHPPGPHDRPIPPQTEP